MQNNHHRQGRTGAEERMLMRAHARRLLLTLADICRQMRRGLSDRLMKAACRELERDLRRRAKSDRP